MSEFILYGIIIITIIAVKTYFMSPEVKGKHGEKLIAEKLEFENFIGYKGKTLQNIYVPKASGETTEIDLIYITAKGILVLESKNYAGYIFGSETNKKWTVTLYGGKTWYGGKKVEKFQFYNPIWQNKTHIKCLREYLGENLVFFSIVTFSNRCELKSLTVDSPNTYVCNRRALAETIKDIWNNNINVLNEEQIAHIYDKLLPLTQVSENTKKQHVQNVQHRNSNMDSCPLCRGKLVLRTAKKGANAGNQFYGCSNYPKCRYTRSLK